MADEQDSTAQSVVGRAKEAVGSATGADSLRDEGRAQQNKVEKQDEVAEKEEELKRAKAQERGYAGQEAKNRDS